MTLYNTKAIMLVEDEYQELEVWYPYLRLKEEGVEVTTVGSGTKSTYESKLGYPIAADREPTEINIDEFDAVIIPGGFAPDNMRLHEPMIDLVREAFARGKIVASICHGGWVLCSAGVLKGKRATGYRPIRDDVRNAGGTWVDNEEVVRDGNVITSRTPEDLPAFAREIVSALRERAQQKIAA